ncbi:MAG: CRISPR-associated endonuclease Cas3'' [Chthoniobacteraceae bacterium]|nr:CRISPR-associated endonuclease Cas3'' [Chthoniobacteraceae bacterium]
MPLTFDAFFRTATSHAPYGYQCRLACGPDAKADQPETLRGGTPCQSQLISIPTGLGKTAAVVLAWLWNRIVCGDESWPRRLVYCLPMRTLVEQTQAEVSKWIENLRKNADKLGLGATAREQLDWLAAHSPVILMGGEELDEARRDWDIHPERSAVLIGTQDMLLSRALNRGYGMARARWPMHFGLLNNDCLWVMDETQLMGVGVRTSAQLEGLRRKLGLAASSATWWASATLDTRLLETPDHTSVSAPLTLDDADLKIATVIDRVNSVKHLAPLPITLTADTTKAKAPYLDALVQLVLEKHRPGTLTIVILNRVDRVRDLYATLEKLAKKQPVPPRLLVHSRFRPMEREALSKTVKAPGEKILVATQAIEAGVDISARTLITELAPWSSLVQRFGRCNRKGEFNTSGGADVFWINLAVEDPKDAATAAGLALPYTPEQLATARDLLCQATQSGKGAASANLEKLHAEEPLPESHLIRCKDLVDLFDTTPDLAGLDIDVGRYIRDGEERDVQVFWRDLPKDAEAPDDSLVPERRELVRVAVHEFKEFAEKNKGSLWHWDALEGIWREFRDTYRVAPGQVFLAAYACGGYSSTLGWTGEKTKDAFEILASASPATTPRDGQGRDDESQTHFQSIAEHTAHVVQACATKLDALPSPLTTSWRDPLLTAARWHDVGKAHACFQRFLSEDRDIPLPYQSQLLAKSTWRPGVRFERAHFRHELASALAWLQAGSADDSRTHSLIAYLIATHHGKIRLSLRAMPGETIPTTADGKPDPDRLHARGVWQGDALPGDSAKPLNLEGVPAIIPFLDLSVMRMGETNGLPSWSARVLALRDAPDLGIFRLAWLETLIRSADAEGSKR